MTLAYDGAQLLDMTGPIDVFDAANRLSGRPEYELVVASATTPSITTSSGVRIETTPSAAIANAHTLIVPGALDRGLMAAQHDLIAELRRLAPRARRVASVCTGAFLLAEVGLLDGGRATTHWSACDELAAQHPGVAVEPDRIYVQDRDVWTAGGVAAGMDLALALVAEDLGEPVARAAAKWLLIFLHRPGGQSQFSARSSLPSATVPQVRRALDAVTADPADDWTVPRLAELVGVGERHFARLFRIHTGTTPARFVETARIEVACSLLEGTSADLDAVAQRVQLSGGHAPGVPASDANRAQRLPGALRCLRRPVNGARFQSGRLTRWRRRSRAPRTVCVACAATRPATRSARDANLRSVHRAGG